LLESGQLPIAEEELLTWKQRMGETAFLGLRLLAGLDSEAFYLRYGIRPQEAFKAEIEHLLQLGLLEEQDNSIRLTSQGLPVANHVFTYFV
jgi:oxygen-independent coproporphyrinogen-3 oxidase